MDPTESKAKQFDVLYSTLCELQSGLLDSTTKVAGFLLLALGWFATSETTRSFLRSDGYVRNLTGIALAAAFFLYFGGTLLLFRQSRKTLALLIQLDYMPLACYASRSIQVPALLVFVLGNFCLFALAVGLILRIA